MRIRSIPSNIWNWFASGWRALSRWWHGPGTNGTPPKASTPTSPPIAELPQPSQSLTDTHSTLAGSAARNDIVQADVIYDGQKPANSSFDEGGTQGYFGRWTNNTPPTSSASSITRSSSASSLASLSNQFDKPNHNEPNSITALDNSDRELCPTSSGSSSHEEVNGVNNTAAKTQPDTITAETIEIEPLTDEFYYISEDEDYHNIDAADGFEEADMAQLNNSGMSFSSIKSTKENTRSGFDKSEAGQVFIKTADELSDFMSDEVLGHNLAYKANQLNSGDTILVMSSQLGEKSSSFNRHIVIKVPVSQPGMVVMILVPTEPNMSIKVLFRGTDPSDVDSVKRDLTEPGGAGTDSFEQEKSNLLVALAETIINMPHFDTRLTVEICGHSLGGADAQNFAVACTQAIAETNDYMPESRMTTQLTPEQLTPFKRIKTLNVNVQNSAGISMRSKRLAEECVKYLDSKKRELNINCRSIYVAGDLVQLTGEAHLFQDQIPNLDHVHLHRKMLYTQVPAKSMDIAGNLHKLMTLGVIGMLSPATAAFMGAATLVSNYFGTALDRALDLHTASQLNQNWLIGLDTCVKAVGDKYTILDDHNHEDSLEISRILGTKDTYHTAAQYFVFGKKDSEKTQKTLMADSCDVIYLSSSEVRQTLKKHSVHLTRRNSILG